MSRDDRDGLELMRLAEGLIVREISLGDRDVWVVKEPCSDQLFFFEQDEWRLLDSLPESLGEPNVDEFFAVAAKHRLIVGHASTQPASQPPASANQPRYSNPFAIRVPGIDPSSRIDGVIRFVGRIVGPTFGRPLWFFLTILVMVAGLIAAFKLESLLSDVSGATSRMLHFSVDDWTTFILAIGLLKIVHELAHGIACHLYGGRCREMGILFLFGVPCLYCDVSDAWLIRRRRDRMLVSAAGMIAEVVVAALAVFVWASSYSGFLHDVSAMIIVVASFSTIAINLNPLLRYDGYFILSDWWGVPNLASEANAALRSVGMERRPLNGRGTLVAYAIASGVYRLAVVFVLVGLLCSTVSQWIGIGVALPVGAWASFQMLQRWFPRETGVGSRPTLIVSTAAVMLLVLLIPLPHSIRVGGIVRPVGERSVYARSTGTVKTVGDGIEVEDWRLEMKTLVATGQVDEIEVGLRSLEVARLNDSSVTAVLPLYRQRLERSKSESVALLEQHAALNTKLADTETIFDPPRMKLSLQEYRSGIGQWLGTPLAAPNTGATIIEGSLLGRVGDVDRRIVSAFMPGTSIDQVEVGASAILGFASVQLGSLSGRVISISNDPVDELPVEMIATNWIQVDRRSAKERTPQSSFYEIQIELNEQVRLPARLVTPVRVRLARQSLWHQLVGAVRSNWTWAH